MRSPNANTQEKTIFDDFNTLTECKTLSLCLFVFLSIRHIEFWQKRLVISILVIARSMSKPYRKSLIWWAISILYGELHRVLNIRWNTRWARHFTRWFQSIRSWTCGRIWIYSNVVRPTFTRALHMEMNSAIYSGNFEFQMSIINEVKQMLVGFFRQMWHGALHLWWNFKQQSRWTVEN